MSNDLGKAFNAQVNSEFYSAYLYLSMAAYFKSNNLTGFAAWLEQHAQEELQHAIKIYNFILARNWQLNLLTIKSPDKIWQSPKEVFTVAYAHEQQITKSINHLATMAIEQHDHATSAFLQWFVNEQIEEEATISNILHKISLASDAPAALLFLDNELAKEVTA